MSTPDLRRARENMERRLREQRERDGKAQPTDTESRQIEREATNSIERVVNRKPK